MADILYGAGTEDFKQAEWLADRLNNEWRYDFSTQEWHHYDGVRWAIDKTDGVVRRVSEEAAFYLFDWQSALRLPGGEARVKAMLAGRDIPDPIQTEVHRKALKKLLSLAPITKALEALSTLDGYGTDGSDWDNDPNLLGCANGIVDLRLNALVESSPEQLVTRNTGTKFKPVSGPEEFSARAPRFIDFLASVTSDFDWTEDASMVSFLLLWFGASLFGFTPEQRFLLMTGSGRNGKGALRHAIMQAVGAEYTVQPDANLYSRSKFGPARSNEARADLMSLRGRRIAFVSEPDRGQFNEEMLKAHTGGDIITARNLFDKHMSSWEPTHSITFLVNDAPSLEDVGPSMGSRVMVADFRHRFEGSNEDKTLYPALAKEKEGILAILCWAAAAWYESWSTTGEGLILPPRVVEQSRAFMERSDPIAECLRDAFMVNPSLECTAKVAYDAYVEWHASSGRDDDPMSIQKFTVALEKKGMRRYRASTSRGWRGLKPLGAMELAERATDETDEDDE